MLSYAAVVFLLLLCTDLVDGHLARKLGSSSRFGAYFDATADFIVVFSLLAVLGSKGFLPDWILIVVTLFFAQFVVTSFGWGPLYDPIGKYYGSLLYGAIGLRFIISGEFFYDVATMVIAGYAVVSISVRALIIGWSTRFSPADGRPRQ